MPTTDRYVDVVIVGGGIAGSSLAITLARRGLRVAVLERQTAYQDRVRGEFMHLWGVVEAQRLGIADVLLDDAGAFFIPRSIPYDETLSPAAAEAATRDFSTLVPGVPGGLGVGNPAACFALSEAACAAGARILRGVERVRIAAGPRPTVTYALDGVEHRLACRLIVGADGRTSTVRDQAGIPLHRTEPTHLVSGLLVDGVTEWPQDAYALGTEGEVHYFVFPRGGQKVRLYTCTAPDQRHRYAGPSGVQRFLDDFRRLTSVPAAEALANGTPSGPCATYGGEDTWTDVPVVAGVALIGDAAGYNGPITGEGLSLALRDVRALSELLLAEDDWSPARLRPYAAERRERMRRARWVAELFALVRTSFGARGADRRRRFFERLEEPDGPVRQVLAAVFLGPERLPDWALDAPPARIVEDLVAGWQPSLAPAMA